MVRGGSVRPEEMGRYSWEPCHPGSASALRKEQEPFCSRYTSHDRAPADVTASSRITSPRRDPRNAPDRIRTCDLRFRRPTLYPTELRARDGTIGSERSIVRPPV